MDFPTLMLKFFRRPQATPADVPARAYRLKSWPELPDSLRTAAVYQAFSRMGQGPVSLRWFIDRTRLQPGDALNLFEQLVYGGQLESIDISPFATR